MYAYINTIVNTYVRMYEWVCVCAAADNRFWQTRADCEAKAKWNDEKWPTQNTWYMEHVQILIKVLLIKGIPLWRTSLNIWNMIGNYLIWQFNFSKKQKNTEYIFKNLTINCDCTHVRTYVCMYVCELTYRHTELFTTH